MTRFLGPRFLLVVALSMAMILAAPIPVARASSALVLDGTGSTCSISSTNAVSIQASNCGPLNPSNPLCSTHPGGFCPLGDLVILQILLNNTGTITQIQSNQGLDHWYRRASLLNGLGGRMEEWYATTTEAVSSPAIYITETTSGITVATQEFAIAGYDSDAPFDPNPLLPSDATGATNSIVVPINTSHPDDLVLGLEYGGGGTISPGQGFMGICLSVAPCQFNGISPNAAEYAIVANVESGFEVSMTQMAGENWGFIADAVKASSPAIISISPNHGIVGSSITIMGISLNDTIELTFCGTPQPVFIVTNDTTITTVAPQLSSPPDTQTCDVVVTTKEGSSATLSNDRFSFLPKIASVNPTSGGVGTAVTIRGTSFTGATSISICGVSQSRMTITNDTQIVTTVPAISLAASTKCTVSVMNSNGSNSWSEESSFTFLPQTRTAPTSATPLLLGKNLLLITLILVAATLLFGSRVVQKRESTRDFSQDPPTRAIRPFS